MKRLQRLLCRLGLHSWEEDFSGITFMAYRICRRPDCHKVQWIRESI